MIPFPNSVFHLSWGVILTSPCGHKFHTSALQILFFQLKANANHVWASKGYTGVLVPFFDGIVQVLVRALDGEGEDQIDWECGSVLHPGDGTGIRPLTGDIVFQPLSARSQAGGNDREGVGWWRWSFAYERDAMSYNKAICVIPSGSPSSARKKISNADSSCPSSCPAACSAAEILSGLPWQSPFASRSTLCRLAGWSDIVGPPWPWRVPRLVPLGPPDRPYRSPVYSSLHCSWS